MRSMALRFHVSLSSPLLNFKISPKCEQFLPFPPNSSPNPSQFLRLHRQIEGCFADLKRKRRVESTKTRCSAKIVLADEVTETVKERSVSVVLLAGGKGRRMGASMPKQYLPLLGQPIALYSFYTFSRMSEVKEIVVVCDPSYRDLFEDASEGIQVDVRFALPGKERQDSVFSGFQEIDGDTKLVCIHDSARPLVMTEDIKKVFNDAWLTGAAVLGVHVKATIKEANSELCVVRTLDRKTLWEMQTPQVIRPELLSRGFEIVHREHLEVTDDVSIVEHLKHPVHITEGSYTNIKVTTPDDMLLAERILNPERIESVPQTHFSRV